MKIILESLGIHKPGGPRTVALNLFKEIFIQDKNSEYLLLLTEPEPELLFPHVRQQIIPIKNRFAARLYLQAYLPRIARKYDLVHFTKNLGVWGLNKPYIVTVHDLTTVFHPEIFPYTDVLYWRYLQASTLRSATSIITVSKTVAEDISNYYKIPAGKLNVVYHGINSCYQPAKEAEIVAVRKKYNLPQQYILHVGRIDPKKNLTMLVKAFKEFKERGFQGKLVLVGEYYEKKPDLELKPTIEKLNLSGNVIFTGRVPNSDLPALYSGAFTSVFPSIHEGFGLVALEALACGSPLVTHKAGAVAEVVEDSAIVIDDVNPKSLADAFEKLHLDDSLRKDLQEKSVKHAQKFSWSLSAAKAITVYENASRHQ